jgi:hypothetical protein
VLIGHQYFRHAAEELEGIRIARSMMVCSSASAPRRTCSNWRSTATNRCASHRVSPPVAAVNQDRRTGPVDEDLFTPALCSWRRTTSRVINSAGRVHRNGCSGSRRWFVPILLPEQLAGDVFFRRG